MYNPQSKYINPENQILRFMREKRQLTLLCVGKEIGIKPKVIDHIENGRKSVTDEELTLLLGCYRYSKEVFLEMVKLKPLSKKTVNLYFLTQK